MDVCIDKLFGFSFFFPTFAILKTWTAWGSLKYYTGFKYFPLKNQLL